MLEDYTPVLKLWTIRLLSQPRAWRAFVKKDGFKEASVAEWLGFDPETGLLRGDEDTLLPETSDNTRQNPIVEDLREYIREMTKNPQKVGTFHDFLRDQAETPKPASQTKTPPDFWVNFEASWPELKSLYEGTECPLAYPNELKERLDILGKGFGLNEVEQKILLVSLFRDIDNDFADALNLMGKDSKRQYLIHLSVIFQLSPDEVVSAIHPASPLFRLKLLRWSNNRNGGYYLDCQDSTLTCDFLEPGFSIETLLRKMVRKVPPSNLQMEDFSHLRDDLEIIIPYLKISAESNKPGVNVLLHGQPGTGKTQLSRLLGQAVERDIFEISTENEKFESSTGQRMDALNRALILMKNRPAILVFDEAEDLFQGSLFNRSFAQERKGQFNHLLENNPIPIIWISNSIRSMDPAFLRRFDFILEFAPPTRQEKKRIFRHLGQEILDDALIAELAECADLSPAVVARACQVATSQPAAGGNKAPDPQRVVRLLIKNMLKAQGHEGWRKILKGPDSVSTPYRTRYLNTTTDLGSLADSLIHRREGRICLYGPPGTGKTSFAHFLSQKLEIPLLIKRASDLLSPYLGETEQKMAEAFDEATREGSILLIDEVDSFLRDRRYATRSWEATQVNEFLTQMESFAGIFIASTNLVDNLDEAAARRFDFKVHFDYLRPEQVADLFQEQIEHFGLTLPEQTVPEEIHRMHTLTPGDFANLARQHRINPFPTARDYLSALQRELNLKSGQNRQRIGFS